MISLNGAELTDLQLDGTTLVLWLEGVPRLGLLLAGEIRLTGIRFASSHEPRYAADAFPLKTPTTIRKSVWAPHSLHLECLRETGPGDADEPVYDIGFDSMAHDLQPSLGRTLRHWAGFYPLRSDRRKRLPGAASVSIAALLRAADPH